ncbi:MULTISPECIES: hypothetical protein [Burkholderia]|uniref:hypothetical protein n=1 Tax=Burkholderia TaxID=32008 RepID=UPI0006AC7077|nr:MULTISPECIES: hypothetical protein [Burkholderia cepacia complex]KOR14376.1 hypothetical protein ABW54_33770 [Burkholderia cenocepacia]MDN7894233.1 hypothetical protein [Burkholderia cepacia]
MALTPGFQSARDLLEKLNRDRDLLDSEVTSDRFFNFVVTAYSLCDWVKNDPAVPANAKTALATFRQSVELQVCRDLANSLKHYKLNGPSQQGAITSGTDVGQGWGMGRWGYGGWGVGEQQITIDLNDGTTFNALQFAATVLQQWQGFFAVNQL